MTTTYEYEINEEGVVLTGRPGNSPGLWAHDTIEHTVIPHPNSYIDEFLAAGSSIAYGDPKDVQKYLRQLVKLLYKGAEGRGELDILCPEPPPQYKVIRDVGDLPSELVGYGLKGDIPYDHIAGWMYKGAELFIERFPNCSLEAMYELNGKIFRAWYWWRDVKKFDRLTIDLEVLTVYGEREGWCKAF